MNELETEVRSIMSMVFNTSVAEHHAVKRVSMPQWDSLKHVELLFVIEDEFNIEFDKAELSSLDSLQSIVSAIQLHQS